MLIWLPVNENESKMWVRVCLPVARAKLSDVCASWIWMTLSLKCIRESTRFDVYKRNWIGEEFHVFSFSYFFQWNKFPKNTHPCKWQKKVTQQYRYLLDPFYFGSFCQKCLWNLLNSRGNNENPMYFCNRFLISTIKI